MRVGVLGATGRMGRATCGAVLGRPDLDLVAVAASQRAAGGELRSALPEAPAGLVLGELAGLLDAKADVVVDFSTPEATIQAARRLLPAGVHLVSGTTGLDEAAMAELRGLAEDQANGNALWAPNFALGAVLAAHFAAVAARFYAAAEVIELHHGGKADAPSGTAIRTAERIAAARGGGAGGPAGPGGSSGPGGAGGPDPRVRPSRELVAGARGGDVDGVRVHSVRLPGLVAHQEVIFGGDGEVLTLRHDSLDRSSFMPGVLLAVRKVGDRPGLTVGLEPLLDLERQP